MTINRKDHSKRKSRRPFDAAWAVIGARAFRLMLDGVSARALAIAGTRPTK